MGTYDLKKIKLIRVSHTTILCALGEIIYQNFKQKKLYQYEKMN